MVFGFVWELMMVCGCVMFRCGFDDFLVRCYYVTCSLGFDILLGLIGCF